MPLSNKTLVLIVGLIVVGLVVFMFIHKKSTRASPSSPSSPSSQKPVVYLQLTSPSENQYLVLNNGSPISTTPIKEYATPLVLSPVTYSLGPGATNTGKALMTPSGYYINIGPTSGGNVVAENQNMVNYENDYVFNSDPGNATLILNTNNIIQAFFANTYWYALYVKDGVSNSTILNYPGSVDSSTQYYTANFRVVQ